jgi:hypothetical protein
LPLELQAEQLVRSLVILRRDHPLLIVHLQSVTEAPDGARVARDDNEPWRPNEELDEYVRLQLGTGATWQRRARIGRNDPSFAVAD